MTTHRRSAEVRDGFVAYGGLGGPELDPAFWGPVHLPRPEGGAHVPIDPNAETAVGDGEVRVAIPRFSIADDTFQPADSPKYLVFSTRTFGVPRTGPRRSPPTSRSRTSAATPGTTAWAWPPSTSSTST